MSVQDRRRAYLAAEGAGRVATAIRGYPPKHRPVAHASLFGYYDGTVTFDAEYQSILGLVASLYQVEINALGGAYGYDGIVDVGFVAEGSVYSNDCRSDIMEANMFYCGLDDSVTLGTGLSQFFFTNFGDGGFAGAVAHEFGHGAQRWLGWDNVGALWYQLYREGLADCFAGAWYWSAYYNNYLDYGGFGGRIDSVEFVDALNYVNTGVTDLNSHGDNYWRNSWINYGWNNGFVGCNAIAYNWYYNIT